jgi:rifampicin phosphotransferase
MSYPRIIQFHDIQKGDAVGGKAEGLARLITMQLNVPPGFVILDAAPGVYPNKLEQHYLALGGGKVAVRSSAIGEDSSGASFAGQYETILDVEGITALQKAIDLCLASVQNERASAYRDQKTNLGTLFKESVPMAIVVQEMVDARCAGVLFTAEPVSNRRDHIVIDAVPGTGEKLVSGEVTPDHYVFDRSSNKMITKELSGAKSILTPDNFKQLVKGALKAEQLAGEALDMEWAIDRDGDVCWLQARPITTLASDLNELDSALIAPDHIFTKCNVSEALPGALCPLTHSISGRGLDIGMQRIFINMGIMDKEEERAIVFGNFYGHLFINMTTMAWTPKKVLGISADDLGLAICGRLIPELDKQVSKATIRERLPRIIKHFRTLFGAEKNREHLRHLVKTLELPQQNTVLEQWQIINQHLDYVNQAFYDHYIGSMGAGTMAPLLLGIIAQGKTPTDEHHATVAALLSGADDVESADIAKGAANIQQLLLKQPFVKERFIDVSLDEALTYLRSTDSGAAGKAFADYIKRHGHRSISEMDIRMKEWACDPLPLIQSLQVPLRAALESNSDQNTTQKRPTVVLEYASNSRILDGQNFIIKKLVGIAHNAVRGREASKSLLLKVLQKYKIAYRQLGQMMVADELLKDNDLLYFFTHKELGEYIRSQKPEMQKQAELRRKAWALQQTLVFADVFTGKPTPIKPDLSKIPKDKFVKGKNVSRGYVIGRAKIARTVSEAAKLQVGDILIAPITDVGWTPYFSLIAGLVTDIGSAVSHGAVVAREYGLPAIVKTDIGTQTFKDGDIVVLDANEGYVRMATEQEAKSFLPRG